LQDIFGGQLGPRRDIVVINAAAALVAAGVAGNFMEAALSAARALSSGTAQEKLADLKKFTNAPAG
jgi:anthranilate phosphoribosyltransferase